MSYLKSTHSSIKDHPNLNLSRLSVAVILATFATSSLAADGFDLNFFEMLEAKMGSVNQEGILEIDEIEGHNSLLGAVGGGNDIGAVVNVALTQTDCTVHVVGDAVNVAIDKVNEVGNGKKSVPVLNFMEYAWLESNNNQTHYNQLHTLEFDVPITVTVKAAEFDINSMSSKGQDNPGLFISNKKKSLNFNKLVTGQIYYTSVKEGNNSETDSSGKSTEKHPAILAGVYTAFGAANLKSFDTEDKQRYMFGQRFDDFDVDAWKTGDSRSLKKGRTTFNAGLNLRIVNSIKNRVDGVSGNEDWTAAYGVYVNEGGGVYIKDRANLIAITSDKADYVSAIHLSANAGVLDPFKQGEFKLSDLNHTSRIWALSTNQPIDYGTSVGGVGGSFVVRNAVEALHGATVDISDGLDEGWLDIRGNIVAGAKNSSFPYNQKPKDHISHVAQMEGKVNSASVTINLSNANSKLFGNVYERHRIGMNEVANIEASADHFLHLGDLEGKWLEYVTKLEQSSLGGKVDLSLSNGATWYPLTSWHGWDASLATELPTESGENKLDQYNLYTYDAQGSKQYSNKISGSETDINDSDFIKESNQGISYIDRPTINSGVQQTVDNGIFNLTLNGGVVDTRFMRMEFGEVIGVKETDNNFHDDMLSITQNHKFNAKGIKTLRIQNLTGSGQFNLFVQDAKNHDLLVVDKVNESKNNQISIWNLADENLSLGIVEGDKSTYVQLARADKDMSFNNKVIYKQADSVYQWSYELVRDGDESISKAQAGTLMHESTDNWFLVSHKKEENPNITKTAVNAYNVPYLFATKVERLQKRMGEVRHALGQDDGAWVRVNYSHDELEDFEAKASMIEVGFDSKSQHDSGAMFHGVALSYLKGDADYTQLSHSESETKRYRASVYQTWLGDSGAYVDLVGRVGWYDSNFTMNYQDEKARLTKGEMELWAASASVESGHKFNSENHWYIEPQVQLQYTYLGSSDYTSSMGVKTKNSDVNSLIGRAGLRLGKDAYDDKTHGDKAFSYYIRGDILHEFMGDREFTMQGLSDNVALVKDYNGDRTWYDVGLGVTGKFNKDSYFFLDVERQYGSDIERIWEVNVGLRWHF